MVRHLRDNLGLTVHHGVLEDLSLEAGAYDAIVLNHVLEHVQDPFTTLEEVARLLRPGGIVRIEVPNLASLSSRWKNFQSRYRLKRNRWRHYATGHHFWYFTPRTLIHVIETSGLQLLRTSAPGDQWGEKGPLVRVLNPMLDRLLLGGALVAYGSNASRAVGSNGERAAETTH